MLGRVFSNSLSWSGTPFLCASAVPRCPHGMTHVGLWALIAWMGQRPCVYLVTAVSPMSDKAHQDQQHTFSEISSLIVFEVNMIMPVERVFEGRRGGIGRIPGPTFL